MTKGKIVLVPFPFDDLTASKVRPAVCLTETIGRHRHVVMAFITSQPSDEMLATDVTFDPRDADFPQTGLKTRSTLRLHRLVTLGANIIARELGVLNRDRQSEIVRKLMSIFGS